MNGGGDAMEMDFALTNSVDETGWQWFTDGKGKKENERKMRI